MKLCEVTPLLYIQSDKTDVLTSYYANQIKYHTTAGIVTYSELVPTSSMPKSSIWQFVSYFVGQTCC